MISTNRTTPVEKLPVLGVLASGALAMSGMVPPALAQDTSPTAGGIETIVVTAQRRAQDLSDVPIAVDAIGGDQIQVQAIVDVQRLAEALPSLVVAGQNSTTGGLSLSLRGIGSSSGDPAVGYYIDEIYQADSAGFVSQFLDVQRVEVLKGPQGTLWGRNTTGGAVHYITKDPVIGVFQAEAYAEAGGYDSLDFGDVPIRKYGAAMNFPVADTLALRVSAAKVEEENYTVNKALGGTQANQDAFTLRADLLWKPLHNLSFELGFSHIDDPFHNAFTTKADPYFEGSAIAFALGLISDVKVEDDTWAVSANAAPVADFQETGYRLEANWELSDQWTVRSLSAYKTLDNERFNDLDALTMTLVHNYNDSTHDWWSQEFQALFQGERLSFIGGAYYFAEDSEVRSTTTANWSVYFLTSCNNRNVTQGAFAAFCPFVNGFDGVINPAAPDGILDFMPLLAGGRSLVYADFLQGGLWDQAATLYMNAIGFPEFLPFFLSSGDETPVSGRGALVENESIALYGQASYQFTDTLTATAGLRWTKDTKDQIGLGWGTGQGFFVNDLASGKVDFESFTPKFGLEWRPTDDILTYVSATRGYKSGAINLYANIVPGVSPEIKPETIWAYELGFKGRLHERMIVDAAAFYYDYSDYQYSIQFLDGPRITNIPEVSVVGLEADVRLNPIDPLMLSVSATYVKSEIESDLLAIDPFDLGAGASNVKGRPLPRSPKTKITGSADYAFDLGGAGTLTAGASINYSDKFAHDLHGTFPGSGYTVYNANIHYLSPSGTWWANLYGRNLSNKEYQTASIFADSIGEVQFFAPPRTIGVQVGMKY